MDEVSEEILNRAAKGDRTAFEIVYNTYSGFVYRNSLRITESTEDAEEVTQEVFIRVFKNLKNFNFNSAFGTYLYRIVVNTAINYKKNKRKEYTKTSIESIEEPHSPLTPDEEFERKELAEVFLRFMEILSEEERECFSLKEVEGMKYEEIAILLNENINTVKTRVRRARERLINEFKGVKNELQRG